MCRPILLLETLANNMNTLLWFQRDLRIANNPSLNWALQQGKPIVAVYIYSPEEDAPWSEGAASRWWLHQSLTKLSNDLSQLNITLHFIKGNSVENLVQLANEIKFESVVWTKRIEPKRIACETQIEKQLKVKNIIVKKFSSGLLQQPNEFLTATKNTPYKVFTPFYRKLRRELDFSVLYTPDTQPKFNQENIKRIVLKSESSLDELGLLDSHHWHNKLLKYWKAGEVSAHKQLEKFIDNKMLDYLSARDIPSIEATSSLSPHLHFGEISPQQILTALVPLIEHGNAKEAEAAEGFLRQLIWREFARYIMWHFPHTTDKPMNEKFSPSFWSKNKSKLNKWQQGNTGISIVDAGMKQLWETGSMHNRVRMLVASLLTKNMGISWQQGAQWFWDTLVDADLANNSMGWQWVAGCGVDAAPYFRIFNPETQEKKFDKDGIYTQRWLNKEQLASNPIVDLNTSRKDALQRYNQYVRLSI